MNWPLQRSKFSGMIGAEFSRVIDAVNSLRPVGTPGMLTSRTTAGVKRVPLAGGADPAATLTVERLRLVTNDTEYLLCERVTDDTVTFYVAKPEMFYSSDDDGLVGIAYPDRTATLNAIVANLDALAGEREIVYPVDPVPISRWQRVTPAYREARSIIYAMRLAEPLDFSGTECTHIDLNIGDVRRWETLAPLDGSHDVPITFS